MQVSSFETVVTETFTNLPEPPSLGESNFQRFVHFNIEPFQNQKHFHFHNYQQILWNFNQTLPIRRWGQNNRGRNRFLYATCQFGADNNTNFFNQI